MSNRFFSKKRPLPIHREFKIRMNYLPTSNPLLHAASGYLVLIDSWLTTWQSFYAMYLLTKSESEGFGRFATFFAVGAA